ncbi:MAG: hypothetical protein K2Y22_09290 [Candidatus Obscuribacterales bacterium]|nr:hypothetical protein [Candidatus Obscuribacterales bacterium]
MRPNQRIIIFVTLAALAFLGACLLFGQTGNIQQAEHGPTVVVAAVDLPAGKPITSDCVKEEESRTEPKPGTLDSYALAVGRIPIHAIPTGSRIHEDDLVPEKK